MVQQEMLSALGLMYEPRRRLHDLAEVLEMTDFDPRRSLNAGWDWPRTPRLMIAAGGQPAL